jgi:hypothetical protein
MTLIEVVYQNKSCLPCVYMEQMAQKVMPRYGDRLTYRRIDLSSTTGKKRFLELSTRLFGHEGVYRHHRLAPVPALFVDSQLVCDMIPPEDELIAALDACLTVKPATNT